MPPKVSPESVVKALTTTKPKRKDTIPDNDLLKTGSTILDLAISGRRAGGITKGRYFWMVGDSSSGKTFLMLTCLAEASINPSFAGYRFIYDNAEDGALMDFEKYFGARMAARVEAPGTDPDTGAPMYSERVEDFYYYIDDALAIATKKKKPFIYLLDSMDALDSRYSNAKFLEAKKAARGGTEAKGDYGDGKAKINSTRIRTVVSRLRESGSILIILSQTRDNIGAGMFEEQQTHAGGHALKFYATVQLWSKVGSKIKKTVRGKDVVVGVHCRVRVKKNRITGRENTVEFPIYYDTGIDDIGGMVDFLVDAKCWPKSKTGVIDATADFDGLVARRDDLIQSIEENDLRSDLEDITEAAWKLVQSEMVIERKLKYD